MEKYDHYIALDWAQSNMALAHCNRHTDKIETIDVKSDLSKLKQYIGQLKGKKILTFEESSPAQWLYTELIGEVDELIVCEPYNNHLLKAGPKNDRIDAIKLLRLLKADMLKPVFHCQDDFVRVRKVVSGYEDLVQMMVQLKNRRKAMFRSCGQKAGSALPSSEESFVLEQIEHQIAVTETTKLRYESELRKIRRKNKMVQNLESIPGIGLVGAVKIAAIVIDPRRFKHKTGFWLYCGLQKHELISGGKSYGKRSPRYCRKLKVVFKTAALVVSRMSDNNLSNYYQELQSKSNYPEHQARHALSRRIATLALGIMKTQKPLAFD